MLRTVRFSIDPLLTTIRAARVAVIANSQLFSGNPLAAMQVRSASGVAKYKLFSGKTSFSSFVLDEAGEMTAFGDNRETLLGLLSDQKSILVPTKVPFEGKIAQVSSITYRDLKMVALDRMYFHVGGSTVVLDEAGDLWGTTSRAIHVAREGKVHEMPTIFRILRDEDTSPFRFDKITFDFEQKVPFQSFSLGLNGAFCIDKNGGLWRAYLRAYWNLRRIPDIPPACRVEDCVLCTAIETTDGSIWCIHRDQDFQSMPPLLCKTEGISFPLRGMSSSYGRIFALDGQGKIWEFALDGDHSVFVAFEQAKPFQCLAGDSPVPEFVSLSVGYAHLLALDESGHVWSCSLCDDWPPKTCLGRSGDTQTLQKIEELGGGNVAICSGAFHSLVLNASQTIVAFGLNTDGQLGLGHTQETGHPTPLVVSQ